MHFIIEFSNGIVQLSSVYNICAIKSMIVLEMKCPQLSKPEATAARNENSIGDRMEKKPWEKPGWSPHDGWIRRDDQGLVPPPPPD